MAQAGDILNGRYRLDRPIGQGGFARVFVAADLRLGRTVAVKVLDPAGAADPDFARRFDAEARALAALDHPHILAIHDYGQDGETVFLVVPYVAGGTLAARLAGATLPGTGKIAAWLRQAAAALDYAHARGIVHRDVKPQNLPLRDDDHLPLADFGIAKVLAEGGVSGRTGAIGTLSYMAPEQFDGRVGPATDVYALGCVLCELLTGAPPFTGATEQIIRDHLLAPPPSLAAHGAAALPPGVQAVFDRALAKDPAARFASAGDLARAFAALGSAPAIPTSGPDERTRPAIRASIATLPAAPTPPLPRPRTPPPERRRRWPLALALALAAAIVVAGLAARGRLAGGGVAPTATGVRVAASAAPVATTAIAALATPTGPPMATPPPTATPPPPLAATQTRAAELSLLVTLAAPTPTGTPVPPTAPPAASPATATAAPPTAAPPVAGFQGKLAATLTGHSEYVVSVAWSPDGRTLASGAYDNTVRLWDADGRPTATLRGHTDAVGGVAWSPDGQFLASGAADNDIRLWTPAGQFVRALRGHTSSVFCLAWSPDGRTLASGSGKIGPNDNEDYTVRLWAPDGRALATLRGHTSSVMAVAWSPDGRTLASVSVDQTVRLWGADGRPIAVLTGHTDRVIGAAWSPDGRTLATAGGDRTIRLWAADGRALATLTGHTANVNAVAWSPDGRTLASGSLDRTIRLWDATGKPLGTLTGHTDSVRSLAWSPDGRTLASGSLDNTVRLWR